jgi:hypothetical protein
MNTITKSKRQIFLDGMARTLDIRGSHSFRSPIVRRYLLSSGGRSRFFASYQQKASLIDRRSLSSDWKTIGNDIRRVLESFKPEV